MKILKLFYRQRQHFKNRLKKRRGNIFYLLFAKPIDKRGNMTIYKFKKHIFFVENNILQTYIKSKT